MPTPINQRQRNNDSICPYREASGDQQPPKKVFSKPAQPDEVSPMRYRIGLVMFCLPLLKSGSSHVAPQLVGNHVWVDLLMGLMLIASVFVLGGNFWDKIRALFFREARAVFPEDAQTARTTNGLVADERASRFKD